MTDIKYPYRKYKFNKKMTCEHRQKSLQESIFPGIAMHKFHTFQTTAEIMIMLDAVNKDDNIDNANIKLLCACLYDMFILYGTRSFFMVHLILISHFLLIKQHFSSI